MADNLELANVEAALVSHLAAAVGVVTSTRVPNPRPSQFIRVQRIGGDQVNLVQERPLVLIECWANGVLTSWNLARQAHSSLLGSQPLEIGGVELGRRELSSPVNYPDPSTTQDRYQFTAQMTVNMVHTP